MFDNYYDEVDYLEKEENLDRAGNIVYKPSTRLKVRLVGGGAKLILNGDGTSTKYTKEYHIPQMVNEGDKIDGRLVVNVQPNKDIFGTFHFCIVKVE